MLGIHPELRRHTILVELSSLALLVAGAALVYATLAGLPLVEGIPETIAFLVAACFIVLGYVGAVLSPRWYRHATQVVQSATPVHAMVSLRLESDSDSTHLYADVQSIDGPPLDDPEVALLIPRWDVAPLVGEPREVEAWRDPESGKLLALRLEQGLLWSMPQWGHR